MKAEGGDESGYCFCISISIYSIGKESHHPPSEMIGVRLSELATNLTMCIQRIAMLLVRYGSEKRGIETRNAADERSGI